MSKTEKFRKWDLIFGWDSSKWIFKEWPSKNRADYYLKECPAVQISDPDMPF